MLFNIRDITKVMQATSGRLFGRVTPGTGRAEELTPSQVRSLISVYSASEVDAIIGGIDGLTSADIDTLAEINAILTDADLASISYVDSGLGGKQATLVSGTNIKTINSTSLLGSGDIAISASPAGTSGQVQFNNAGSFGGASAVVYAATGTHIVVTSQGATVIPLCLKGAASQTGLMLDVQTSAGLSKLNITQNGKIRSNVANVTSAGVVGADGVALEMAFAGYGISSNTNGDSVVVVNSTVRARFGVQCVVGSNGLWGFGNATNAGLNATVDVGLGRNAAGVAEVNNGTAGTLRDLHIRNLGLNGAISAGGGVGIASIANATTVPTTNPTGGGVLYCEGGALKYRGSSGTVTTLGPA